MTNYELEQIREAYREARLHGASREMAEEAACDKAYELLIAEKLKEQRYWIKEN